MARLGCGLAPVHNPEHPTRITVKTRHSDLRPHSNMPPCALCRSEVIRHNLIWTSKTSYLEEST